MSITRKTPTYVLREDKENPFGTKEGQEIVSVRETYWARIARMGRFWPVTANNVVTGDNAYHYVTNYNTTPGFLYYPKKIIVSTNLDMEVSFKFSKAMGIYGLSGGNFTFSVYLKAGTPPYEFTTDGEFFLPATELAGISLGGKCTADATLFATIWGFEVAEDV